MKKFKALFSLIFFLLLVGLPSLTLAAEIEVFPGGGSVGSNTTEAGWTDNHMIGQSFAVQAGVTKINRIRLTDFKLGHAGGNNGGIVSVAIFAGEPAASTQVATSPEGQSHPDGYEGRTTVITPNGPMLAREERIFIGGDNANTLASLCGVDQNSIEALFLKRLIIINPQRPCPSQSEWDRAYRMLTDQGLRDEWSQWGVPYGSGVIFGESTFDWSSPPPNNQPAKYTYPNHWTFEGGTLTVTIPNHQLTAGQYFLSIQQSHLDQNRGSEEGGYWEQGRYNCDRPNEPRQVDLYGTNTGGSQVRLNNPYCGKGNVFIAGINTQNAYGSGRAYFNTFYYSPPGYPPTSGYNAATGDLANLQIWAEASFNPVGYFEGGVCTALTGWTCDGDNYNASLRVDFYADGPAGQGGTPLTSATTTSLPRDAGVGAQCGGNPNHGFSYAIPANALRDGRSHQIYAYGINIGSGTHTLLPGSPKPVTCISRPPTIDDLVVNNGATPAIQGTYKISGLSREDNGGSWLNPINITLRATATQSPIKEYYVAFYDRTAGQLRNQATFTQDVRSLLNSDPKKGILLRYDRDGSHYLWNPCQKAWQHLESNTTRIFCNNTEYYRAIPKGSAGWELTIRQGFGSKNMFTAAQVFDNNTPSLSAFREEMSPIPTP